MNEATHFKKRLIREPDAPGDEEGEHAESPDWRPSPVFLALSEEEKDKRFRKAMGALTDAMRDRKPQR